MPNHVAALAIDIPTLGPTLLEEAATLTLATILSAVCNVLMPLHPLVFGPTICAPTGFVLVLFLLLFLATAVLSHCSILSNV